MTTPSRRTTAETVGREELDRWEAVANEWENCEEEVEAQVMVRYAVVASNENFLRLIAAARRGLDAVDELTRISAVSDEEWFKAVNEAARSLADADRITDDAEIARLHRLEARLRDTLYDLAEQLASGGNAIMLPQNKNQEMIDAALAYTGDETKPNRTANND